MALKGGAADKAGNVYESYWAVEDICYILLDKEDSSSIYFEKPDEIKDGYEYIVNKNKKNYCIQVKNYDLEWTISNLYSSGVLSNLIKRIDEDKNAICVFLSSSNTELDEIVDRAKRSENKSLFFNSMITSEKIKNIISKLREKIISIKFADKDITSMNKHEKELTHIILGNHACPAQRLFGQHLFALVRDARCRVGHSPPARLHPCQ